MATKGFRPYSIDGHEVKRYLFGRWVVLTQAYFLVEVEAFNKDHAVRRLCDQFTHTAPKDWDYIEELAPEHFVGRMGYTMPPLRPTI